MVNLELCWRGLLIYFNASTYTNLLHKEFDINVDNVVGKEKFNNLFVNLMSTKKRFGII